MPPQDSITDTKSVAMDRSVSVADDVEGHTSMVDFGNHNHLLRRLGNRQIQLMAIGGAIGTGLFISIGSGLHAGGPGSLLIAFAVYCGFVAMVNNGMAEMVTQYPVAGGFIRLAGHFGGEAWGFMAGWNYFIYEALVIPFEISSLSKVVQFWNADAPVWAICLAVIVTYIVLNMLVVNVYGEFEFWLATGKVVLVIGLFLFTLVTMCGGNPRHDAYGFRYWTHPGAFAASGTMTTNLGLSRWEGFLSALWTASFCVVGPEYVSLAAAESKHPRVYIKAAYKTIYWRFLFFFLGSALAVGIVVAYNDPTLVAILIGTGAGGGTAAASPYVIAMTNLGISVLPHMVNALLVTSIFSAGNSYVYCTSRSLHSLALEGRAPAIFTRCTRQGVPVYCLALTMVFSCLAFLQCSPKTSGALGYIVDLVTGGAFINYLVMSVTYVLFHRALAAQGVDRKTLPYCGWFQPYCGYAASVFYVLVIGSFGYTSFLPFNVKNFFGCYAMAVLAILTFSFWAVIKRSVGVDPACVDLVWECPEIDAYEASTTDEIKTFWGEMEDLVLFWKKTKAVV
ncbi:hypothetical protein SEUCBS139899_004238 [Sporothrix eucalyptigena]|uniref:Amino acid permease/ SLC12A domain-containing protein n=1 Tax=Sporothrix eucalyptigena TaxID=1812306 RepID=A0ABP0B016_9PEZI